MFISTINQKSLNLPKEENKLSDSNRIAWLDICKGLGILLVVLGHSGFPKEVQWWIWSFHMPLFFILSGIVFKASKFSSLLGIIKNRSKTLLLPYLVFSIFVLSGYIIIDQEESKFLMHYVPKYGWPAIALWFIPVLFLTEILYYTITSLVRSSIWKAIIILSLTLLGYLLSIYKITFPYKVEVVFTAVFFLYLGNTVYKKLINRIDDQKNILKIFLIAILAFIVNVVLCFQNNIRFDLCYNLIGLPQYAYLSALFGSLSLSLFSVVVSRLKVELMIHVRKILIFLGLNTLIILAVHQIIMLILIDISQHFHLHSILSSVIRHPLLWLSMYYIIVLINSRFRFILGRN